MVDKSSSELLVNQKRIIYVPGKNLKPEPEVHRNQLWRCLLAGVRRVQPDVAEDMERKSESFFLAPWNHILYRRHVSLDDDIQWIDRLIETNGPTEEEKHEAEAWHKVAIKIMYAIGDHFHGLIKWIPDQRIKAMIADTAPYFENENGIADAIRAIVKQLVSEAMGNDESVLLIGHSMGSVIAYDALWQLTHIEQHPRKVDLFLTIGSPLGMHYVQRHLLGGQTQERTYPQGILNWENVSATGDLISLDKTVHDDFVAMIDQNDTDSIRDHCGGIYNWFRNQDGLNVHRSYGYLVNPVVGKIIADWWQGHHNEKPPVLVAHRGYPTKCPENTIISYEQAVKAGARAVELDVQLSKDKVPVLYHDADTMRMSGVPGSLFDLTLEELKKLDIYFPERFGEQYRGTSIATLEEFCAYMESAPNIEILVEIKPQSVEHFGIELTVDRVVAAIEPVVERCVVISFHDGCIAYARSAHKTRIGWVLPKWSKQTEARARELSPEFILVSKQRFPNNSCKIWSGPWRWVVYVVDDAKHANQYAAKGIRYIETDRIGEMLAEIDSDRGQYTF